MKNKLNADMPGGNNHDENVVHYVAVADRTVIRLNPDEGTPGEEKNIFKFLGTITPDVQTIIFVPPTNTPDITFPGGTADNPITLTGEYGDLLGITTYDN